MTIRLSEETRSRLERRAAEIGSPPTTLAQRLVDEGLRMVAHPGITFRSTPSGARVPGLVSGPEVASVVVVLEGLEATGEDAASEAAEWLGLRVDQVRTALRYYAEFSDEVDADVAQRQQATNDARARWEREQRVLGSSNSG